MFSNGHSPNRRAAGLSGCETPCWFCITCGLRGLLGLHVWVGQAKDRPCCEHGIESIPETQHKLKELVLKKLILRHDTKVQETQLKTNNLEFIKIWNRCFKERLFSFLTRSRKRKDNPKNERKYLQIMYLIRDLYLKYLKNSYNSKYKKTNNPVKKIGQGSDKHISKEDRYTSGQWSHEKMLQIISHQGNLHQNHSEIPLYAHEDGYDKKTENSLQEWGK